MYGIGFYDEYLNRMGNLRDKPDMATPFSGTVCGTVV